MDIKQNFNNLDSFPDVIIISNRSRYHLHKNIICQVSPHLKACVMNGLFKESSLNVIDLSFSEKDYPNLSPVMDDVLKYMYTFPIQVEDCYLGLMWSGFNYLQIREDDVLEVLGARIRDVSLRDYHCIFRDVVLYNGQTCSSRVMSLLMSDFEHRIKNGFEEFFDEFDYPDQYLLESVLEILKDDSWESHEEKKRKADQVVFPLVVNRLGVNHPLAMDYISFIGKIDDSHLLSISDSEMNEETSKFYESYVYDHFLSIGTDVLPKLSFLSRNGVPYVEFRRQMERKDREISELNKRIDLVEGRERTCKHCGSTFTLSNNTPCRFHDVLFYIIN
eukprot:TRINITY_DN1054_c0_g2_i1.p1 TRINITY_DN1054_c0_g2~~TRINITY_DN1054_c0_g2_i1.p1  ORF type:complete len:333 (+),score=68.69 TRINITY_DN1054_c0_g2_i1:688-1686(+)